MLGAVAMPLIAEALSGQYLDPFNLIAVALVQYGKTAPGPLFVVQCFGFHVLGVT